MGNTMFLTIFTPVFNGEESLERLFDSLLAQTSHDFEFILVDDGSTDTTALIAKALESRPRDFPYTFIRNKHGGLHTAMNTGLRHARGELFLYLNCDSYLYPDAVSTVSKKWAPLRGNEKYAGVVFRKLNEATGKPIGSDIPDGSIDISHVDAHFKAGIKGDKAEFCRTELLQRLMYPEIPGETYFPVGHPFNVISADHIFRYSDIVVYVAQYLPGGLSSNFPERLKKNPKGFLKYYTYLFKFPGLPLKRKIAWLYRIIQCKIAIARNKN